MRNKIDLSEISDVMVSLVHYNNICENIIQISSNTEYKDSVKEYMNQFMVESHGFSVMTESSTETWQDVNIYLVKQIWGSTACGWGGMGGAAMTASYTLVIENNLTGAVAVYYHGRLAYIAKHDDVLDNYKKALGFRLLPPYSDTRDLNIIYKHPRTTQY